MTTSKTIHASLATLNLPKPVPALITFANSVVHAMTNHPAFATPSPTLAAVTAAIADLQSAETGAIGRAKGAVATRNEKRVVLVSLLVQLKAYVQSTADADADNSASIIQSSGIAVRKSTVRTPRVFAATQGALSGEVKLITKAASNRASYDWQYSVDGGKTWVDAPSTLQAKTTVSGLAAGTTVQFRYRANHQDRGGGLQSAGVSDREVGGRGVGAQRSGAAGESRRPVTTRTIGR
jgi:hypothetical protein